MSLDHLAVLPQYRRYGDQARFACPACDSSNRHKGSARQFPDGRISLKCWGGCGAGEILGAVGLDFSVLYPPRPEGHFLPKVRRPFTDRQLLEVIDRESIVAHIVTADEVLAGRADQADLDRLRVARDRLAEVLRYV